MTEEDYKALCLIMRMYSFESFLYREVNRASREKDRSKIANLGAFGYLLTKNIQRLNPTFNKGTDYIYQVRAPGFVTYRGLSLNADEVETYRRLAPGKCCCLCKNLSCYRFNKKRLNGFTSTTLDKSVAEQFSKSDEEKIAVVFEIYLQNTHHNNYFFMGEQFSAYPDEQEVLLHDGLEFLVTGFSYKRDSEGRKVAYVQLYNSGVHQIPRNVHLLNYELIKQQLNNETCGGQCQWCCIGCLQARWNCINRLGCFIWYFCCNCFCVEPLKYMPAQAVMNCQGVFLCIFKIAILWTLYYYTWIAELPFE